MLATLVALAKLGSLVHVTTGAGFWCYCAMTLALIFAQNGFAFGSDDPGDSDSEGAKAQALEEKNTEEACAKSRSICTALGITAAITADSGKFPAGSRNRKPPGATVSTRSIPA